MQRMRVQFPVLQGNKTNENEKQRANQGESIGRKLRLKLWVREKKDLRCAQ